MKQIVFSSIVLVAINMMSVCGSSATGAAAPVEAAFAWPPATNEARPWTRWWWMGSAVNKEDLTRELARYRQAGLGGVEITPIYGVQGREAEFIQYLSPRWMEMMQHSVATANDLGMGVDMATGTGWCFGGPNVSLPDANATVVCRVTTLSAGEKPGGNFNRAATQALMAYPSGGSPAVEITGRIDQAGTVDWTAPTDGAPWTLYSVTQKPSGVVVKRPAPGGAGPMLNLLYGSAMDRYLQRFGAAFAEAGAAAPRPAGMFHDSYEYRSDWAPDFFAQFEKRRGYRLQDELPALFGTARNDHVARVKSDDRETISDIMVEESIPAWTRWSHAHGFTTREQAHGSPGNWLDIYAAADVPETEMFNQDRDILVSKFASSAAHVTGKNLVGAEAGTWVAEHFTETLADLKSVADDLFVAGVNRLTFHGTAYSPDDAPWPGWCFYASTELNPRNALWHDLPALNTYITRVQSLLQQGHSDNDIWLYWPIHDRWHDAEGMVQPFTIHERDWLYSQPVGVAAKSLAENGYLFDYVSDRQLALADSGDISAKPRVIVVPTCRHLPAATFMRLLQFAAGGTPVIFQDRLPDDVPGFGDLEKNRAALQGAKRLLGASSDVGSTRLRKHDFRGGTVLVGDLMTALEHVRVPIEAATASKGIRLVRRTCEGGQIYFVSYQGNERIDQWVTLGTRDLNQPESVLIQDPMTGGIGLASSRKTDAGDTQFRFQIEPGGSLILRTLTRGISGGKWVYHEPQGPAIQLSGRWKIRFVEGGPELPPPAQIEQPASWTHSSPAAESFSGTAVYSLIFNAPDSSPKQKYTLDLGEVRHSARVRLNGEELGTVFTKPYRVLTHGLRKEGNLLEVEVTSTSANRIRDLDARKVPWKIFHDANVVSKDYKPFDASRWPIADQGLLGPVTLQTEAGEMR